MYMEQKDLSQSHEGIEHTESPIAGPSEGKTPSAESEAKSEHDTPAPTPNVPPPIVQPPSPKVPTPEKVEEKKEGEHIPKVEDFKGDIAEEKKTPAPGEILKQDTFDKEAIPEPSDDEKAKKKKKEENTLGMVSMETKEQKSIASENGLGKGCKDIIEGTPQVAGLKLLLVSFSYKNIL